MGLENVREISGLMARLRSRAKAVKKPGGDGDRVTSVVPHPSLSHIA